MNIYAPSLAVLVLLNAALLLLALMFALPRLSHMLVASRKSPAAGINTSRRERTGHYA